MLRILADVNAEGYLATIVRDCQTPAWRGFWQDVNVQTITFADVGLDIETKDRELWAYCQNEGILLFTCNRKKRGPDSLEAAIIQSNTPVNLPVITLANQRLFRASQKYRERTAVRMLEVLLDLERFRGAGRLYIPVEPS